jgi:hypothetical protein
MTDLSPAALAIWEAFNSEEPSVFVDYGDCLAAALRAAVEQSTYQDAWDGQFTSAEKILAIADELDRPKQLVARAHAAAVLRAAADQVAPKGTITTTINYGSGANNERIIIRSQLLAIAAELETFVTEDQ